ncbi:lasso peptide biosynthesis PqqD family chaperone [Paenibacillus sp. MWE-103]|uniref:Lasso peptide biosynthesis PqqD family chaperone n=1 Tax=Paenibacillus artemisiicola TaxID=1172618 RepID=A0ABS3WHJ5_9BACL|nr:lasso peptide biosynthesis PqqD family chaperone [Paenibacillus artemisiicola]MBO7747797.1 lasso peptide biosynthesis PqqD family chaperone [Paenibacillus artemisiicola]
MTISKNETVVQTKGNLASNMNGEMVMFRIESGKYFNIGRIGGRIWSLIESPITVEALITELTSEFEVTEEACEAEVVNFLEKMAKEQLIVVQAVS